MAEERKNYSKGFIGDIFEGGASRRLNPKNDDLKDARDLLVETEGNILKGSGVSDEDVAAYVNSGLAANQADHEETAKDIRNMAATNTFLNVLSLTPIAAKGVGKVAGKVASKLGTGTAMAVSGQNAFQTAGSMARAGTDAIKNGHVLAGIGQYTKAGTHLLGRGAATVDKAFGSAGKALTNTAKDALRNGLKAESAAARTIASLPFGNSIAKGVSLAGYTIRTAPYVAPVVAAQMYTRGRVDAMDKDLSDALDLVLDRTDYINSEGAKLTGEAGEAYGEWHDSYTASMGALTDQLEAGEITQAQFDELYEVETKARADALAELDGKYPEMAKQMITEGEAYRMAETGAKIGADLDAVGEHDSSAKRLMEDHPDAKALYVQKRAEYEKLDTGSSFTNFIASMHAALVHYMPGFAYLEAGVIKAADAALGFVANNVPVLSNMINYQEHYEGQSITFMASRIVDTAEARYETQQGSDATTTELRAGQDAWKETQDEQGGPELSPA